MIANAIVLLIAPETTAIRSVLQLAIRRPFSRKWLLASAFRLIAQAPKTLFLFAHAHRRQCRLEVPRSKAAGQGELLKQQSRRGGHRDGFALSPIRAIFSDGIRWVVETGSEVVRLSSLSSLRG
jgi:hypothetical protein